jgi:hypothetical protein
LAYNSKTNHQHDVISVQFFQVPSMYAPEQEYDWGFATRENGKNITHWMPLPKPPEVLE